MQEAIGKEQASRLGWTLALAVVAVGVALAFPVGAPAAGKVVTAAGAPARSPWQGWADRTGHWTGRITVVRGRCDGSGQLGWAEWDRVCVRSGIGRSLARWTFLHELGHTVDYAMSDAHRAKVQRRRGWRRWRPERFADDWASCGLHRAGRKLARFCAGLERQPELAASTGVIVIGGE